jgi:hypothetical protein
MVNGQMNTEGEYFTIGNYIALRKNDETRWTISKMHLSNRSMTIVFQSYVTDRTQAIAYMEASTGTDTLEAVAKTVRKTDIPPRSGHISENPDYWTKGNEPI